MEKDGEAVQRLQTEQVVRYKADDRSQRGHGAGGALERRGITGTETVSK